MQVGSKSAHELPAILNQRHGRFGHSPDVIRKGEFEIAALANNLDR
jgi:hypothetical protein